MVKYWKYLGKSSISIIYYFKLEIYNMATHCHSLFKNIPKKDFLHLFSDGEPDPKKILNLLKYNNQDIATATNIRANSIRYDEKMPIELKERLIDWAIALNLVANFFKDEQKTILWFRTPNHLLGDMTPRDMIKVGRFKKLFKFIKTALDENPDD